MLYLVGALFVGVLLVVWLLADASVGDLEILDKLVQVALVVALVVVFVVLLYREGGERAAESSR